MGDDWTDDIEEILSKVRQNCIDMYKYHLCRYFQYKRILPIFRVPVLILNALNSVFSVGLQPYMEQSLISVLNCMISLIATLINSIEMYMGIQKSMESEMSSSQGFYILSIGIYKMLTLTRENRDVSGKQYLMECYNTYSELVRNSKLIKDPYMLQKDFLQTVDSVIKGRDAIKDLEDLALKPIYTTSNNMSTNNNLDIEMGKMIEAASAVGAGGGGSAATSVIQKKLQRPSIFGSSNKKTFLEIAGVNLEENVDEIPTLEIPNQLFGRMNSIFAPSSVDNSSHFSDVLNHNPYFPRNHGKVELDSELSTSRRGSFTVHLDDISVTMPPLPIKAEKEDN
jgi:hypothetical protein